MAKLFIPHPILATSRLRLRQFRAEDTDAMHVCFADPEVMRFWNHPPHTKRLQSERAVRNLIDCTPSYYRFWAVADAKTDHCLGMVNYHDGHIRNKRVAIGLLHQPHPAAAGPGRRGRPRDARFLLRRARPASRAGLHPPRQHRLAWAG